MTTDGILDADVVIIGGGFYGLRIAVFARENLGAERVVVLERENEVMERASFVNQARVHRGYHYPRSLLTGYRSRVTATSFEDEFREAIVHDFQHYYAVASRMSKVNGRSFETFCERIQAPLLPAPPEVRAHFSRDLIEDVWEVSEHAFDSRVLRDIMLRKAAALGVVIERGVDVRRLLTVGGRPAATTADGRTWRAHRMISAAYSGINLLHAASGLSIVPVQHERTEMLLVQMPRNLQRLAFTVMDGPFFSLMPFPSLGWHTLSHVRYTPHDRWRETSADSVRSIPSRRDLAAAPSASVPILLDVRRYLPAIEAAKVVGSLREVKTVLLSSDHTDSRPILVRDDDQIPSYTYVVGGKIDNIDDVLHRLNQSATPTRGSLKQ